MTKPVQQPLDLEVIGITAMPVMKVVVMAAAAASA
jgi:hypothetical protein